jgi:uncharacterized membrane protein YeaQ/YmgE (transglycosylase-associated protein family)
MNFSEVLVVALVAIVFGTFAQLTSGYSRGGWIVNVGIAFLGAVAGTVISRLLNAPVIYDLRLQTSNFPIIYTIVGSVFFIAALGFIVKPRRR